MRSYKEVYEEVSNTFDVNYIWLVKRLETQEEKVSNLQYTDESYKREESLLLTLETEYDLVTERFFEQLKKVLSKELKETYVPNESDEFAEVLFVGAAELNENLSDIEIYYVKLLNVYQLLTTIKGEL